MRPDEIDLTNLDHFSRGAPHELFTLLRRESPVHWHPETDGPGFWALTRHADILAVSRDGETFSSGRHGVMCFDLEFGPERPPMMIEMDAPRHTRYRTLVNRAFTPRRVAELEGFVRARAGEILDRAAARRCCDLVEDVAAQLPLLVILELMGVPQSERPYLFSLANRVMGFDDPEYADPGKGENSDAIAEMAAFSRRLCRGKERLPGTDLTSALLEVEVDGERLSERELDIFFLLLVTAGSETTRNAISGGALAFNEHPEQWERLRTERALMPQAVEEVLRWTTPVQYMRRTATRDTEIGDRKVGAGEKLLMWYISANRDEAVFHEPFRFDLTRDPNDHLSFGFGRHFCLGASLARLEVRAMLEAMFDREATLDLLAPPQWLRSNFAHSIKRMPVELRVRD